MNQILFQIQLRTMVGLQYPIQGKIEAVFG